MRDLWTKSGARLRLIRSNAGEKLNWLFLPAGPGFDSSYFLSFTVDLPIAGNIWHLDLPGNGSNVRDNVDYSTWQSSLTEAVKSLHNVILVAHSFGAIFTLCNPDLESELVGLVLLNGASVPWSEAVARIAREKQLPSLDKTKQYYDNDRSDATFKRFSLAAAEYFFTPDDAEQGREILQQTVMAHAPFDWAVAEILPNYEACWIPSELPTLVIGGEHDYTTPFELMQNDPRMQRENIELYCIKDASHFPWIQQKQLLIDSLVRFSEKFQGRHWYRVRQWTDWIGKIQAIAQNGLTYTENYFDKERYQDLSDIAAEITSNYTQIAFDNIQQVFAAETGYATPKVDVRAAVFKDGKLLLVQERSDNLWSLPGGWADVNTSPAESVCREVLEEAGLTVKATRLIAFYDKQKQDYPPQLPHTYKCFFLCELISGELSSSVETQDAVFFGQDEIPALSPHRVSREHIEMCFKELEGKEHPAYFD